jgi:hypothetical protein
MSMRGYGGWILLGWMLISALGCDSAYQPAVGQWVSQQLINGEYNEMDVDRDFAGDATIYFFVTGDDTFYWADFELELTEAEIVNQVHKMRFEMDCDGSCSDFDFTMTCELSRDEEELECEGDGAWETYELFDWERD